jgi:sugar phosphate isomerase/epimerase
MLNRRTFLRQAACTVAGAAALNAMNLTKSFAAAKLGKIGVQLYTVRDQMAKDFDGSLRKIAEIGYKQVEFAGYYNHTPEQVKALLAQLGLESPSVHVPLADLRDNLPKAIDAAKVIGHRYLICPFLMPQDRKTLDQYKQLAATLNQAGATCKKAGLQLAYHNHDFEFMPLDGKLPYDVLLTETDKNLLKLELDLYWIVKAKQDPIAWIEKTPGRFVAFHVKDKDATPKEFFTEVGRGTINFKEIFAKSKKSGVELFIVEQDQCPGSPFDSLKISYDYLRKLEY